MNPEPQPIRHLREFSNYLAPRTGLTSVDFWTLITTFIRNMFLNWLVLISWLAAAMMIPRLYLAAMLVDGRDAPDGIIVYIKPACYGDEPRDIYEYFKTIRRFRTRAQVISSSRNRNSRATGCLARTPWRSFCTDCDGDFRCFIADILKRHLQIEPPALARRIARQETQKQDRVSA